MTDRRAMRIEVNLANFWDMAPDGIMLGRKDGDPHAHIFALTDKAKRQLCKKLVGTYIVHQDVCLGRVEAVNNDIVTLNLAVDFVYSPLITTKVDIMGNVMEFTSISDTAIIIKAEGEDD